MPALYLSGDGKEASFHTQWEAEAFADKYGGTIDARGVAWVVTGADTEKAKKTADDHEGDWSGEGAGTKAAQKAAAAGDTPA